MYHNYYPYQLPHYYPNQYNNQICPCMTRQYEQIPQEAIQEYTYDFSQDDMRRIDMKDYGKTPFVFDIEDATEDNKNFRTALWTGKHLQLTLMSINVGDSIGLEVHPNVDQFLKIEEGHGLVQMGDSKQKLTFERHVDDDDAVLVPAGKWHNITNTGRKPLKLYTIYAPAEHPFGTVHQTKADALAAEH